MWKLRFTLPFTLQYLSLFMALMANFTTPFSGQNKSIEINCGPFQIIHIKIKKFDNLALEFQGQKDQYLQYLATNEDILCTVCPLCFLLFFGLLLYYKIIALTLVSAACQDPFSHSWTMNDSKAFLYKCTSLKKLFKKGRSKREKEVFCYALFWL